MTADPSGPSGTSQRPSGPGSPDLGTTAAAVAAAIRGYEFRYSNEYQLQEGLAGALTQAGFEVQREVRLSRHERIDLVIGRVGIEVKVAGTPASVARQCRRYLRSEQLDELVLVSNRPRHRLGVGRLPVEVVTMITPW